MPCCISYIQYFAYCASGSLNTDFAQFSMSGFGVNDFNAFFVFCFSLFEKHGFLPGDLNSKMEPWTRPLFDVLREYYSPKDIERMLENQTIEISPLAFMRGRTFKDSWIIADEMQNATPSQMKMLMTRIGENSKIIITGDVEQTDRRLKDNGLIDLCARLEAKQSSGLAVCYMSNADIQRHPIIDTVLDLYAT